MKMQNTTSRALTKFWLTIGQIPTSLRILLLKNSMVELNECTQKSLFEFFKWPTSYIRHFCVFQSFSRYNFNNTNWKHRWCAWDSNKLLVALQNEHFKSYKTKLRSMKQRILTYRGNKYHCTADFLLRKIWFDQTSKSVIVWHKQSTWIQKGKTGRQPHSYTSPVREYLLDEVLTNVYVLVIW